MSKKIVVNDKDLVKLYNSLPPYGRIKKLSEHYNISQDCLRRNLKEQGVTFSPLKEKVDTEEVIRIFNENGSFLETSRIVGLSEPCVRNRLKSLGYSSSKKQYGALKHILDTNIFKDIDSENKAYWLGFIAADGCVYTTSNTYVFQINLSINDYDHLEKMKTFLNTDYPVATKNNVCTIQIPSKRFCENLINNSIVPRKSKIYEMPVLDTNLIRHFVRGYFDGDGHIGYDEKRNEFHLDLVTASVVFFEQLKKILPFHFNTKVRTDKKYPDSLYYYFRIGNKNEVEKAFDWLYEDATIYLERKYECFSKIKSCIRVKNRSTELNGRKSEQNHLN